MKSSCRTCSVCPLSIWVYSGEKRDEALPRLETQRSAHGHIYDESRGQIIHFFMFVTEQCLSESFRHLRNI